MNLGKASLKLHKKHGGKIEVKSKIKLQGKLDLSLAYTPGVAEVCKEIFKDKNKARELTIKKNTIAVVTDGSAVLGLGNLGPEAALPVMEGKCLLFKELASVDAFPICLATQNTEKIIEVIKNIAPVFGGINLEDISSPRCFEIEARLRKELNIPVLHDDQHGTAMVVLAALINALKLKKLSKEKAKIVLCGAGAAGTAVSKLLLQFGVKNLVVCDKEGSLHIGKRGISAHKQELAKLTKNREKGELKDVLKNADVFIGLSVKNILNKDMIKSMNPKPVIFALANPNPEILPGEAKRAGAFIVASGRSDFPNQINNVLGFPGIFRGALDNRVKKITSKMLIKAAENLSASVKNLSANYILPDPLDKNVSKIVAKAIK